MEMISQTLSEWKVPLPVAAGVAGGALLASLLAYRYRSALGFFGTIACEEARALLPVTKEAKVVRWVHANATRGDPASVLAALDHYGETKGFLMSIGPVKGALLRQEVDKARPKVLVELGSYVGYSTILLASSMPADAHLYALEYDPFYMAVARAHVELAGLSSRVTFVLGAAGDSLARLQQDYGVQHIDLMLLDHVKNKYVPDTKIAEEHGLFAPGSVLFADNIYIPGAPEYVKYMQDNSAYSTVRIRSKLEYCDIRDDVMVSTRL